MRGTRIEWNLSCCRICVNNKVFLVLRHEALQNLQQVLEEIDVHEVRKSCDSAQRRGKQRRRFWIFEHAEVEHEQQLEGFGVLNQHRLS